MGHESRRLGVNGKRILDIENAYFEGKALVGRVTNHYLDQYKGVLCITSKVLRTEGNIVETKQHVYNVLSWDDNKTSRQLELF